MENISQNQVYTSILEREVAFEKRLSDYFKAFISDRAELRKFVRDKRIQEYAKTGIILNKQKRKAKREYTNHFDVLHKRFVLHYQNLVTFNRINHTKLNRNEFC